MLRLSEILNVPPKAIRLAKGSTKLCKTAGCRHLALENNRKRCAVCAQSWYPKSTKKFGHLLLGPEFLHQKGRQNCKCCCPSLKCFGIGYCNGGNISFPKEAKYRKDYLKALGCKKNEIPTDGRNYIGYWHFRPEHRYYDQKKQRWYVNYDLFSKEKPFFDPDLRTNWIVPPPSNPLNDFIEIEMGKHQDNHRRSISDDDLRAPGWAKSILEADEEEEGEEEEEEEEEKDDNEDDYPESSCFYDVDANHNYKVKDNEIKRLTTELLLAQKKIDSLVSKNESLEEILKLSEDKVKLLEENITALNDEMHKLKSSVGNFGAHSTRRTRTRYCSERPNRLLN